MSHGYSQYVSTDRESISGCGCLSILCEWKPIASSYSCVQPEACVYQKTASKVRWNHSFAVIWLTTHSWILQWIVPASIQSGAGFSLISALNENIHCVLSEETGMIKFTELQMHHPTLTILMLTSSDTNPNCAGKALSISLREINLLFFSSYDFVYRKLNPQNIDIFPNCQMNHQSTVGFWSKIIMGSWNLEENKVIALLIHIDH